MIMLAIFFVRAVNLVQTEHVNDNFRCIEILFIFGELVRRFLQRSGGVRGRNESVFLKLRNSTYFLFSMD